MTIVTYILKILNPYLRILNTFLPGLAICFISSYFAISHPFCDILGTGSNQRVSKLVVIIKFFYLTYDDPKSEVNEDIFYFDHYYEDHFQ